MAVETKKKHYTPEGLAAIAEGQRRRHERNRRIRELVAELTALLAEERKR